MAFVATREGLDPELVRAEVRGRSGAAARLGLVLGVGLGVGWGWGPSAPQAFAHPHCRPAAAALPHGVLPHAALSHSAQVARGRAIIPANVRHLELEPTSERSGSGGWWDEA